MIKKILGGVILALVLCFTACEDEQLFGRDGNTTIRISATAKFSGAESRAVLATEYKATENNVFMLYKGTDKNATLEVMEAMTSLEGTIENVLIEGGATYTAIMIANAPKSELESQGVVVGSKLEALYSATYAVNTTDNKPTDAAAFTWSGVVCGITTANVRNGLNFELNPNVAKVTVNITNNSSSVESTQLVNVQVRNVANKVRFAQNALSKAGLFTSDDNKSGDISYIDYEIEELDIVPDGAAASFSWYVPHNECGTGTRPQTGVAGVLPAGQTPTYVEIDGVRCIDFLDTGYKVYPGIKAGNEEYVNMTNFDVKADYQYTINADITNNGLTFNVINNSDQVNGTEGQLVKLPSNANCYMIHPIGSMIKKGTSTVYELPIDRINEYWGTEGLAPDASMALDDNSKWKFFVIWQDIPERAIYLTDKEGNLIEKTNDAGEIYAAGTGLNPVYFKLANTNTNAESQTYGNILVGVRKDGQAGYLWSWHLWITDYNPDAAITPEEASGVNTAKINRCVVEGEDSGVDRQGYITYSDGSYSRQDWGNVQHWEHNKSFYWGTESSRTTSGEIWTNGLYKNKWIMDRYLGAQSANGVEDISDPRNAYGMYYQFGRKDPFPFADYKLDGIEQSLDRKLYNIDGSMQVYWESYTGEQQKMEYSIKNPTTFCGRTSSDDWADATARTSYLWNSPVDVGDGGKSIFDPCPPGWCVPLYEAFDFMTYNPADSKFNNTRQFYDTGKTYTYDYTLPTLNSYEIISAMGVEKGLEKQRNCCILTLIVSNLAEKTTKPTWSMFPLQGGIDKSNALKNLTYTTGFMWTAKPYTDGTANAVTLRFNSGTHLDYKTNTEVTQTVSTVLPTTISRPNGETFTVYNGRMSRMGYVKARGHNVRCIQTPNKETLKFYNKE